MGKKKQKKFKKLAERRKNTMGLFKKKTNKHLDNDFERANKAIAKASKVGQDLAENRYWNGNYTSAGVAPSVTNKVESHPIHCGDFAVTLGKTHLFGAAAKDAEGDWELVIDCANIYSYPVLKDFVRSGPDNWKEMGKAPASKNFPVIRLDWPDMTAPWVGRDFWEKALDSLPAGDVLVCCFGGHGRTGTALAALMVVSGQFTAAQAIAHLRKDYCKKAVETASQEAYLKSLENEKKVKKVQDTVSVANA